MDRTIPPPIRLEGRVSLLPYTSKNLGSLPAFLIGGAPQAITQITLVFPGGRLVETCKGATLMMSRLLTAGTSHRSADDIAHQLDYWGASLKANAHTDDVTLTAYCLDHLVPHMLDLIHEVLTDPVFPEEELQLQQQLRSQKLKVQEKKVTHQATRHFMGRVFGYAHPYGYRLTPDELFDISRKEVVNAYEQQLRQKAFYVFVAGKIPDAFEQWWTERFSGQWYGPLQPSVNEALAEDAQPSFYYHPMPAAQQSAIRMGRLMPHIHHPDYFGLKVLNTILGGYFGSRLMSNIREDKGYTYGIYSTLHSYGRATILYVSTEVGATYEKAAITEIRNEMHRLQTEPVSEEELTLVRNYLIGNIMGSIDGALKTMDVVKGLILQGQTVETFDQYMHTIRSITPATLQRLANDYLNPDTMTTVVAGPNASA